MTLCERWEPIPTWPGYEVSNLGRVQSYWTRKGTSGRRGAIRIGSTPKLLKGQLASGRLVVTLGGIGKTQTTCGVAYLVLLTFVRPPLEWEVARHYHDPDPTNCQVWNLCWGTCSDNAHDITRHRGRHPNSRLSVQDREAVKEAFHSGATDQEVSERFNLPVSYAAGIRRKLGILYHHSTKATNPETDKRQFNAGTGINAHNHPTNPIIS